MKRLSKSVGLFFVFILLFVFLVNPSVLAAEDSWVTKEPMPYLRRDFGVAVVDGKIFAIGGKYNDTWVGRNEMYDPETDTWTIMSSMPTARSDFAIAVYDGKIYAFGGATGPSYMEGGYVLTDATEVYDPETNIWRSKSALPMPRMSFNAHTVGDKIFTLSGAKLENTFMVYDFGVTEVYCPETDSWETKTPIPITVFGYASAAVGDEIFVIGGLRRGISYNVWLTKLNQVYNTKTDSWSNKTAPIVALYKSSAGVTTGVFAPEQIIVVGGIENSILKCFNTTQVYNPVNDTWRYGASMPTVRSSFGVAVVNDTLYAFGGSNNDQYHRENEQYFPTGYIPEFPSLVFLPFVLITVFVVALYRKRMTAKSQLLQ